MAIYDYQGNEIQSCYDVTGSQASELYDVYGNPLSGGALPLDYDSYTITDLFTYVANGFNGFDVYDGIIFQLMANDKLYMFDLSNGSAIKTAMTIKSDHGDSASFSNEKYQASDPYPLLYVTSDTNPAKVYVNRITANSATLIKTLSFPLDKAGYYAAAAYDEKNNIMYMVGYLQQNYQSDDGGNNKTVVSKWDMSNLSQNQDGSFTPAFVTRYFRDFIFVMQGQQFFDGYIWIASGHNNGGNQYIYAMNPTTGVIDHTILLDDHIEVEGLAWVYDEAETKNWMLVGQQNGSAGINYSRVEFATLT